MGHFTDYQILEVLVILIAAGLLAGFSGAFFGVGGGSVLVPVLLAVYTHISLNRSVDMHQAIAASLALVILNSATAAYKHHKSGNLPVAYFKGWALWLFAGTLVGAVIMAYVTSTVLKFLFTGYLFAAFIYILFQKDTKPSGAEEGSTLPQGKIKALGAVIIGGLSLLLGLAGGTFSTPFFTFFKYPIKKAMAISIAGGFIIGIVGTIAVIISGWGVSGRFPWSIGYVNIVTVLVVAPFVMVSSPWGVRLSQHVSSRWVKWLYATFLLLIAIFMAYHLVSA